MEPWSAQPTLTKSSQKSLAVLILLPILILGVTAFIPVMCAPRESANIAKCSSNISQIGKAIVFYANEYGGHYPSDFAMLAVDGDLVPEVFTCPSSNAEKTDWGTTIESMRTVLNDPQHCSYIYCGDGLTNKTADAEDVLVFDRIENHEDNFNVLFADGHVENLSVRGKARSLYEQLIRDKDSGIRPVRLKP